MSGKTEERFLMQEFFKRCIKKRFRYKPVKLSPSLAEYLSQFIHSSSDIERRKLVVTLATILKHEKLAYPLLKEKQLCKIINNRLYLCPSYNSKDSINYSHLRAREPDHCADPLFFSMPLSQYPFGLVVPYNRRRLGMMVKSNEIHKIPDPRENFIWVSLNKREIEILDNNGIEEESEEEISLSLMSISYAELPQNESKGFGVEPRMSLKKRKKFNDYEEKKKKRMYNQVLENSAPGLNRNMSGVLGSKVGGDSKYKSKEDNMKETNDHKKESQQPQTNNGIKKLSRFAAYDKQRRNEMKAEGEEKILQSNFSADQSPPIQMKARKSKAFENEVEAQPKLVINRKKKYNTMSPVARSKFKANYPWKTKLEKTNLHLQKREGKSSSPKNLDKLNRKRRILIRGGSPKFSDHKEMSYNEINPNDKSKNFFQKRRIKRKRSSKKNATTILLSKSSVQSNIRKYSDSQNSRSDASEMIKSAYMTPNSGGNKYWIKKGEKNEFLRGKNQSIFGVRKEADPLGMKGPHQGPQAKYPSLTNSNFAINRSRGQQPTSQKAPTDKRAQNKPGQKLKKARPSSPKPYSRVARRNNRAKTNYILNQSNNKFFEEDKEVNFETSLANLPTSSELEVKMGARRASLVAKNSPYQQVRRGARSKTSVASPIQSQGIIGLIKGLKRSKPKKTEKEFVIKRRRYKAKSYVLPSKEDDQPWENRFLREPQTSENFQKNKKGETYLRNLTVDRVSKMIESRNDKRRDCINNRKEVEKNLEQLQQRTNAAYKKFQSRTMTHLPF